jgi:outer membrane protein TolC
MPSVNQHFRVQIVALVALTLTAAPVRIAVAADPFPAAEQPPSADTSRTDADLSNDAYVQGLIESLAASARAPLAISLRAAVTAAVANNPGARADRRVPEAEQHRIIEAASVFEPVIGIDVNYSDAETPTADQLAGVADAVRKDEHYNANFDLSKLFRTGTEVGLRWLNPRDETNSQFDLLQPAFKPRVGVRVEQPLLRDFGGVVANTNVRIADSTSRSAAADFEESLSDFVFEVITAYWDYTLRAAELEVKRHSHRLATELAEEAQAKVDVGSLPPVAAQEARADAAAREEEVIAAEQALRRAARALQYMVMLRSRQSGAPIAIEPADDHGVVDQPVDRAQSLKIAIERRASVRASRIDMTTAQLNLDKTKTDLLPSLDLVGTYELVGLGGRRADGTPDEYDAYGDALDRLSSGDFYQYFVGLEFEVPLSNAAARARHTRSEIDLKRTQDEMRQTIADVALEVDAGAGDLIAAYQRVAAANLARKLAEENLRQQQRRYEVGMVTTTDVLDFQERLADAMAAEARAITDHAKAQADLMRAEGTLLDEFGIRVSFAGRPEVPWWGKF